jgi:hypothetical protein
MSGGEAPGTEAATDGAANRTARPFCQIGILHAMLKFPRQFSRLDVYPAHLVVHSQQGRQGLTDEHESAVRQGLNGLGYHYWITPEGRIYEVRPQFAKGAHSLSHNGWWGVCLQGDCRKSDATPEQHEALGQLAQYLSGGCQRFTLHLHRDLDDTDCPGPMFRKEKTPLVAPALWAVKERQP